MSTINFSGIASGIDSEALIKATSDATRKSRVEPYTTKKTQLEDTNSALDELKTMLTAFQSTVRDFGSLNGGGVVKEATSSDETKVSATASNAATNGTYSVTVTQLAKNETYSFRSTAGTYTSSTAIASSGINMADPASPNRTLSFSIGTSSPETVSITITNTTTLEDIANSFNASSSRAAASVVNVGTSASPDYRLVVSSNKEGTAEGAITVTVGASITTANDFNNNTESDALDATFTVSGIGGTITRNSNTVSDLITGVTFDFQNTGTSVIRITPDTTSTISAVQDLVDKYNEIVNYVADNNQVSADSASSTISFGPLNNTSVDESIIDSLRTAISGSTYSGGSLIRVFSDLGITTQRDGTLKLNQDTLETALGSEPDSVSNILLSFSDTVGLTGGTIDSYIRFNGLFDVTKNGNTDQITNLEDRISRAEKQILQNEESMRARFARLESLIGGLQNQQKTLSSALGGLG